MSEEKLLMIINFYDGTIEFVWYIKMYEAYILFCKYINANIIKKRDKP
jgi:hypothetical protein